MGNRRPIDDRLGDIDDMIRKENDEEKRNVLLVLHCLTLTLSSVTRVLEELEKQHGDRFEDHEQRIEEHEDMVLRGKASWNTALIFGGIIQTLLIGIAMYGASLFTTLQSEVKDHSNQINFIEQRLPVAGDNQGKKLNDHLQN